MIAAYPDSASGTRALGTDLNFAVPTQHFAERHRAAGGPTWFYRFDAAVPLIGATHAAELPYLWDWSGPLALIIRGRLTSGPTGAGSPDEGPLDRVRPRRRDPVRTGPPSSCRPPDRRATMIFTPDGDRVEADPNPRREVWRGIDVMPRG